MEKRVADIQKHQQSKLRESGRKSTNFFNPQSMSSVYSNEAKISSLNQWPQKQELQKLLNDRPDRKLVVVLDKHQRLAKDAFGIAAHGMNKQFIHTKLPAHLYKPTYQAHLGFGTY